MSSSNRRSTGEELEETDEMLQEHTTKKEIDNEYLSESEEAEETYEGTNQYQYDDFVVPDDYEDDTDGMGGTDTESRKRRRKRRKQKDYVLDKEDTDLIDENLGTSTDRYRRLKKGRKPDTEDDDILEEEDASLSSSYHKERKHQTFDDLKLINQIFHNDTEGEEPDRMMIEDENDLMEDKRSDLRGYFNPEEIEERFQTERDRIIVEKDEPERLQIRFNKRPMPDNPELVEETNWLVEKIMLKNNLQLRNETANLKHKVHKVLEFLRLANCEIMYIWVHKKHDIISEKRHNLDDKTEYDLKLNDLWYIYDLDLEWMQIYQKRKYISALIAKLDNYYPVSNSVKNSFRSCYDLSLLSYYLQYSEYQLKKYVDNAEIFQMLNQGHADAEGKEPQYKRMKRRNFAREVMKYNLHEVANQIAITPDQMAENLMAGDQKYKPKIVNETPDKIANDYSNPSIQMIQMPVDTLTTLCYFMAQELFFHPIIRRQLKKMYNERVTIYTEPTEKGKKEISVYNFYYPVKRIRNKKPADFTKELWLMIIEAEQKELITTKFKLPWDKKDEKDEIQKKLLDLYTYEIKSSKAEGHQEINTINAWNIVREETISKLLKNFVYPNLEGSLREELKDLAEKFVISECAKLFKSQINMLPYRKSSDKGENPNSNEQSRLKVLSCISEAASSKCYFVIADENGELIEYLILSYFGRNPGDDLSLKALYNQERQQLKNLMGKVYPDVIVIGATNLNCQQIKLELDHIASEVSSEQKDKFAGAEIEKPFVMWGISSVPTAWSKTYQAKQKYGELPQELREALSMCRIVQDPLVETLNLWNERIKDNVLLYLNYHVMQHMISPVKMRSELEKIAMEVCNTVGVDINRVIKYRHLASPLQFICGLGPRKSAHLIDKISHDIGTVKMRRELFDAYMQKTVYINAIGFIKILEETIGREGDQVAVYDRLDTTRIHPDFYQIAVKIAKEAFEGHGAHERTDYVRWVLENPKKLHELDLEDYAKYLNQKQKNNMAPLVEFIVHELTQPFQDPRAEFKTKIAPEDLFYKLTKESKYSLREEAIVTVRITRIDQKAVRVVTDSGVPGIIPLLDLKDKDNNIKDSDIGRFYSVGEYLKAKVRNINFNLVRLKLSTKSEDLTDFRSFINKNLVLSQFNLVEGSTFELVKDQDVPTLSKDNYKKSSRYVPRRINHPKFKNISLAAAQEYLAEREIGDFVIRPSSLGPDHLNITWKLSADNVVHLDISEGIKGPNDMISKHLTLDKETYESLDEIIERYIRPCNQLVLQIREHKKFMDENVDFVKKTLEDEKKNDQGFIPYYLSFIPEAAQYLILSYIPRYLDVQHEYIKIKPDGLMFHEIRFSTIKKLIAWFKNTLKTPEYQKYLEHAAMPAFDLNADKRRVKDEYGAQVKKEPKYEKKREKESVYKSRAGVDGIKRRKERGPDDENRYKRKRDSGWGREDWDDGAENKEWNQDWDNPSSKYANNNSRGSDNLTLVKKEGGASRSRSRSQERKSKREDKRGKKSVASKHSFTSEYLHNAWGTNNQNEETWDKLENDANDTWGAKSEIKTENEWAGGNQSAKNEDWGHWNENKTHRTNDQESNW